MIDNKNKLEDLQSLYEAGKFEELKRESLRLIALNENNIDALNALAIAYRNLDDSENAKNIFIKLVNSGAKSDHIYSNAGNFFYDIGNVNNAIQCHEQALKINPKNINSLNQLGMSNSNMGKDLEAIEYYKKALLLDPKSEGIHHNIGNSYRNLKKYQEASDHYELSQRNLSKCQQLECLYHLGDRDKFYDKLNQQSEKFSSHPLAATLSAHAAIRYDKKDEYSFCNKPFEFINKKNLFNRDDFTDDLINDFISSFNKNKFDKKEQSLLKNGFQSSGNIFLINEKPIQKFKNLILEEIEAYKENYSSFGSDLISKWPEKYTLYGWLIIMNKGGSLGGHMHKEGWLSGSIYLSRPPKEENDDGDIIFSLHGSNYPTDGKSYTATKVEIEKGSMILFPSSLFHATIPFNANQQRITLAFDIIPTVN